MQSWFSNRADHSMNLDPKILDKIKKCLALSTSPEPHEAAAALRQAQKLMAMHGVDETTLMVSDVMEEQVASLMTVSRLDPNELHLVKMIATAFGCDLIWTSSSSWKRERGASKDVFGRYNVIGLKHRVPIAVHTMVVMMRRHLKARSAFVKSLPSFYSRQDKTFEANGFSAGWVLAVTKMVQAYAKDPSEVKAMEAYKQLHYPDTTSKKSRSQSSGAGGFAVGDEAGKGESLHRPMDQARHEKLGTQKRLGVK